jgi:hypothetical protein
MLVELVESFLAQVLALVKLAEELLIHQQSSLPTVHWQIQASRYIHSDTHHPAPYLAQDHPSMQMHNAH